MAPPKSYHARNAAMERFIEPLKRSVMSFADGVLSYQTPDLGSEASIVLNDVLTPTRLDKRAGFGEQLGVMAVLYVRMGVVDDKPSVTTIGYNHSLWVAGQETVSYHWHPANTPHVAFPHLHFNKGREHIPTGRVLLEDLFLAALEYGAKPRPRWKHCFIESYDAFESDATWGRATKEQNRVRADWLNRWDESGNPVDEGL